MHPYQPSEQTVARVRARQGPAAAPARLEGRRSALVVIDMQNYFVAAQFASAVPMARAVVPAINRLAAAVRGGGGVVAWVRTTAEGALARWGNHHRLLRPERVSARLQGLAPGSAGYALYPELQPDPADLQVDKITYSAFIAGSSGLEQALRARGIDTVLVGGTVTNVCCESTARDAALLDFNVVMVSDCNAAWTDAEHAATLDTFAIYFGEVLSSAEAAARLAPPHGEFPT